MDVQTDRWMESITISPSLFFLKKCGAKHIQNVTILFDTGSNRTYITESSAKILNFKKREESEIDLVTFGSETPQTKNTE